MFSKISSLDYDDFEIFIATHQVFFTNLMESLYRFSSDVFNIPSEMKIFIRRDENFRITCFVAIYEKRIYCYISKKVSFESFSCIFEDVNLKHKYIIIAPNDCQKYIADYIDEINKIKYKKKYLMLALNEKNDVLDNTKKLEDVKFISINDSNYKHFYILHRLYYDEEVFNSKNIDDFLQKAFGKVYKEQFVLGLEYHNKIVSKVNTTAIGVDYVMIGGVFTLKKYRRKGFSKNLLAQVAKIFLEKDKKICLFVKPENKAALKIYKYLGFEYVGDLTLSYT